MDGPGKLILAFFMILLGVVLIGSVATSTNEITEPTQAFNESASIASLRYAGNQINTSNNISLANSGLAEAGRWVSGSVTIYNSTGGVITATNYTVDYLNAKISFANNTYMVEGGGRANQTYVDYKYYDTDYITQSWARSVLESNVGFFALAIMLIGVGLAYSVFKDNF